jgi:hypothetical protein
MRAVQVSSAVTVFIAPTFSETQTIFINHAEIAVCIVASSSFLRVPNFGGVHGDIIHYGIISDSSQLLRADWLLFLTKLILKVSIIIMDAAFE